MLHFICDEMEAVQSGIYMYIYVHAGIHVHAYVQVHADIHVHVYINVHAYIHVHACIHICTQVSLVNIPFM